MLSASRPCRHREASSVHRGGAAHEGGEHPPAEKTPEGDGTQGGAVQATVRKWIQSGDGWWEVNVNVCVWGRERCMIVEYKTLGNHTLCFWLWLSPCYQGCRWCRHWPKPSIDLFRNKHSWVDEESLHLVEWQQRGRDLGPSELIKATFTPELVNWLKLDEGLSLSIESVSVSLFTPLCRCILYLNLYSLDIIIYTKKLFIKVKLKHYIIYISIYII